MRGDLPSPPTPEEEQALLERMARGDAAARTELIERNLLLVKHVARRYASTGIEYDERFSLGCVGLIYAVDHFCAERGARLSTYIGLCAGNSILREVRYRRMKMRAGGALPLDAPVASLRFSGRAGTEKALGDMLPSKELQPVEQIALSDEHRALHAAVAGLPPELRRYTLFRFFGAQRRSQKDAGAAFGWSQMTAHRRETAALGMCRAALEGAGYYGRSM